MTGFVWPRLGPALDPLLDCRSPLGSLVLGKRLGVEAGRRVSLEPGRD